MPHDADHEARQLRRESRIVFGLTTLLLGVFGVVLLATPAFKRVMDEQGLQLPSLTKAWIRNHRLASVLVLGWWVILAMIRQAERPRKVATLFSRASLVVAFVVAGATVMAITTPVMPFVIGVSK